MTFVSFSFMLAVSFMVGDYKLTDLVTFFSAEFTGSVFLIRMLHVYEVRRSNIFDNYQID